MEKKSEDYNNSEINLKQELESLLVEPLKLPPVKKENVPPEYDGKSTNDILTPELNLSRIGYTSNEPVDWEVVALPKKKNIFLQLYSTIRNFTNPDCKIYIANEEFNCHFIVLQCYSKLFDNCICAKKFELPPDKCSPSSFAFIYDWMIIGHPSYHQLDRDNVLDILNAAKFLEINDLIEQCWCFIDNQEVFFEDTAFLLYTDATEKKLPEVKDLMLPRISKFFLVLVSSEDWLKLDLEDVCNFLQSNHIYLNSEMEVFMAAIRWLEHDQANRNQMKKQVMNCVRFGNIAGWQLVDIKRNKQNPEFWNLANDPEICKMIEDGLSFVTMKNSYGKDEDSLQHWNELLTLNEPLSRNWSGEKKTYLTYREFLIFLDKYRYAQVIEKLKHKDNKENGNVKVLPEGSVEIGTEEPTLAEA